MITFSPNRPSEIESIVEQKRLETGRYNNSGVWVTNAPVGCEINTKSGDKGKVRETFDEIVELMANLGEVE